MSGPKNGQRQAVLNQLKEVVKKNIKGKEADLFELFAGRFIDATSLDELRERDASELYHIMYSLWSFCYVRKQHESKIHVFNPDIKKDGYETSHTVIEISHDDVPFLVDSTRMVLNRLKYQIHYIVHFGGFKIRRNDKNEIVEIFKNGILDNTISTEAPVYIEIDRISDKQSRDELIELIQNALDDVRAAVTDWRKMVSRVESCLNELEANPPKLDMEELAESRDFLRWLISNNFTFLGARDYKLIGDGTSRALQVIPHSGLGVLRDESNSARSKSYSTLPPQARKMALSRDILIIAKTNTRSTVHRDTYTDYIGIKKFDENGNLTGERRFIGLYTSTAYHSSPRQIPFLRHKVDKILNGLGYPPDSHDGKEAVHILDTLPRDDLFQASLEELLELTQEIIHLKEKKNIRLLVRRDAFYRYFSCLVYVPRDIFTTDLATLIRDILIEAFRGIEASFTTYFSDSVLARIHYLIRVDSKVHVDYDVDEIESNIIHASRTWSDLLKDQLIMKLGEAQGLIYFRQYARAFPGSYTEYYTPDYAIRDIVQIEKLSDNNPLEMLFNRSDQAGLLSLKLFHTDESIVLSDVMPIFENMGLKIIGERPHQLRLKDKKIWINDFDMQYVMNREIDPLDIKDIFQEAFTKIWKGEIENDGFNRLVLDANLTYREITMLRAYTKYLRQIGFNLSQNYIEQALVNNVDITKSLVQLFACRFDPACQKKNTSEQVSELASIIEKSLDNVLSLDEDRIIRRLLEVIQATIRTNFYQTREDGSIKPWISYKLDPMNISDLPLPRPRYEIFVYSSRVEGIHLRAGKVARGGLRWSDRKEDYRTEVLGLMKAQQVKNTVIVPEGAKGGFIVKRPQSPEMNREEYYQEAIDCYSTFISGLLDITDNIVDSKIIPPANVIRYDQDDPYLVVAADKGTATFSDIANTIAKQYHFWLDDAFASGGSAGYDHKKMGITSRGVWVSVQRHFRTLGINPDKQSFTVVGIGDMAGDVFGNGMLMSRQTKLLGAFNHQHIFIDPEPDPKASYDERKRLFNLPRSTWMDYNAELISKGGGVFSRSSKSIKLTPEMKVLLNTKKDSLVPNEIIKSLLRASVDLIWNGGIGTFIKASNESHLDVGDRSNDAIRIDANELSAKVIAEGGNLGLTQQARIEYSLLGGIVNTDFIDNSAGVDCSDHEVNIKILMNRLTVNDELTHQQRDKLLEQMTKEIASLVLLDNYDQNLMISLENSVSQQTMDLFRHYLTDLEKMGRLNRKLEFLPDEKGMVERKANNRPLTRPEIAVIFAYSKMILKQEILSTNIPEDPYFTPYLMSAFPAIIGQKYPEQLNHHSLRREIIATQLCKKIIDRMGINFVERLQRETGSSIDFIIKSYSIAAVIFDFDAIWHNIISLDYQVSQDVQFRMILQVYNLIRRATRWFLRNKKPNLNIDTTIIEFKPQIDALSAKLPDLLDEAGKANYENTVNSYLAEHVPASLAKQIASCLALFTSLDIVEASQKNDIDLLSVAKTYYLLGDRLELNWVRELMNAYVVETQWDELARAGFRDDLDRAQRKLCARVLTMKSKETKEKNIEDKINYWVNRYQFLIERWRKLIGDVKSSDSVGFVTYSVVLRELFDFAQAS